jgi:hypothetical protein
MLGMFWNTVVRKIFGNTKIILPNCEIHNSYTSLNITITPLFTLSRMKLTGQAVRIGEVKRALKGVFGKPVKRRSLRRFSLEMER